MNPDRKAPAGKGVRKLTLSDQLPKCKVLKNSELLENEVLFPSATVLDIGCGYGLTRATV